LVLEEKKIDNRKWFVLITKHRHEKKISKRLNEIGVENFLPLQKQLRQRKDRKVWIEAPLFSKYIFVKTLEKKRHTVFEVEGIYKYLSLSGKLVEVREDEIERIRLMAGYNGKMSIETGIYSLGDTVEILEGHFIGQRGELVQIKGKKRLRILIMSLGSVVSIEIAQEKAQKIA
jgi:transcription antitermination factor NusG